MSRAQLRGPVNSDLLEAIAIQEGPTYNESIWQQSIEDSHIESGLARLYGFGLGVQGTSSQKAFNLP